MLDWMNLTTWQRLITAFFSLFIVALWALAPFGYQLGGVSAVRDVLARIAITAFMVGTLLNPDAVRGKSSALKPLMAPTVCRVLYGAALLALGFRGLLGFVV